MRHTILSANRQSLARLSVIILIDEYVTSGQVGFPLLIASSSPTITFYNRNTQDLRNTTMVRR